MIPSTIGSVAQAIVESWMQEGSTTSLLRAAMAAGGVPTKEDIEFAEERLGPLSQEQVHKLKVAMHGYIDELEREEP